jgi:hypothetical protein
LIAIGAVAAAVSAAFLINYAKFETLNGLPHQYYVRFDFFNQKDKLEKMDRTLFHFSNLRSGVWNYFSFETIMFSQYFPWVYMVTEPVTFPESKFDDMDSFASLTASQPVLVVAALAGTVAVFGSFSLFQQKKFRLLLLGALTASCLNLFLVSFAERYNHDFFPFLILAGTAGLHAILRLSHWWARTSLLLAMLPLTLFGVYANAAFALYYQRHTLVTTGYYNKWWGEKSYEFQAWCNEIDAYFLGSEGRRPIRALHPYLEKEIKGNVLPDQADAGDRSS